MEDRNDVSRSTSKGIDWWTLSSRSRSSCILSPSLLGYQWVCGFTAEFCHTRLHSQAQLVRTGTIGPLSFDIPQHQLIENRFSVPQIAQLMGISVSTVRRRMSDHDLSIRATYYPISDEQLDQLVAGVQQQFPNWGSRQMYGYWIMEWGYNFILWGNHKVESRRLQCLHRRCYSVHGPQHLLYSTCRWKLVVHGGIDGSSLMATPTCLLISGN